MNGEYALRFVITIAAGRVQPKSITTKDIGFSYLIRRSSF